MPGTWITRPPDEDWHLIDANAPGALAGRALYVTYCGRTFSTAGRETRLQADPERIPERRRCPYCQSAYLRISLPS